jgi:hypothetical protein
MLSPISNRREALSRWLDANVKTYPTPETVTLSDFEIDLDDLSGTFQVALDRQAIDYAFSFGIQGNGTPNLFWPMFHSPLGVPASYAALHITNDTESAIELALSHLLPRLRPFGLNRSTGKSIDMTTSIEDRILEPEKLSKLLQVTGSKSFQLTVQVQPRKII